MKVGKQDPESINISDKQILIDLSQSAKQSKFTKDLTDHVTKKRNELNNLGNDQIVRSMMSIFSKVNRNQPVDINSHDFRRIWAKLVEYDRTTSKLKLEKYKVFKKQIKAYLLKRYDQR